MHQNHQIDDAASEKKEDRGSREPPSLYRLFHAEERGGGQREETDRRKYDEGENAVERSEAEYEESEPSLKQHGIRRCFEAWVETSECREEYSVLRHRVVDARCCHGERHQSTKHGKQHAGRQYFTANCAEEGLAKLRDKSCVRDNALQRHDRQESNADEKINDGDQKDTAGESQRQGPSRVANLASDFACLPPSGEAEEGGYGSAGNRGEDRFRTGTSLRQRHQIGGRGVSGDPCPGDQGEQHRDLEEVSCCHDATAELRPYIVENRQADEDECGNPSLHPHRNANERQDVW